VPRTPAKRGRGEEREGRGRKGKGEEGRGGKGREGGKGLGRGICAVVNFP